MGGTHSTQHWDLSFDWLKLFTWQCQLGDRPQN